MLKISLTSLRRKKRRRQNRRSSIKLCSTEPCGRSMKTRNAIKLTIWLFRTRSLRSFLFFVDIFRTSHDEATRNGSLIAFTCGWLGKVWRTHQHTHTRVTSSRNKESFRATKNSLWCAHLFSFNRPRFCDYNIHCLIILFLIYSFVGIIDSATDIPARKKKSVKSFTRGLRCVFFVLTSIWFRRDEPRAVTSLRKLKCPLTIV